MDIASEYSLPVTRLGLWRLMYHSWHKFHFYKTINHCKKNDICNAKMPQNLSSLQKSEFLKLITLIFNVKKWITGVN